MSEKGRLTRKEHLTVLIESDESKLKALKMRVANLTKQIEKQYAELEEIKRNEFLSEKHATHLQDGVKLAICEPFYKLMESRHYPRKFTDTCYGQGAVIAGFDSDDNDFYICEMDESGGIGGIPLDVVLAMYEAANHETD